MRLRLETRRPTSAPARAGGYSLIEMLVVLAIIGIIMLVALPNIREAYENYVLGSNARGVSAILKLGRMKAVSNNVVHLVELGASIADKCPGRTATTPTQVFVLYRTDKTYPEDCFTANKGVAIEAVASGSDKEKVSFQPTGMAKTLAPNWFLVKARNGRKCRLVCVNAAGIVRSNAVSSTCTAPYGADSSTPCPPPS